MFNKNILTKLNEELKEYFNIECPLFFRIKDMHDENSISKTIFAILSHRIANSDTELQFLYKLFIDVNKKNNLIIECIISDLIFSRNKDLSKPFFADILLFSPGFCCISLYRFAHHLYKNGERHLAKFLQLRMIELYNSDIHPNAVIGRNILLDHGLNVIIGEYCTLGDNIHIMHNVTLGSRTKGGKNRHPIIKSNIFIGCNTSILGNIIIENDVKIGAGCTVIHSVEKGTTIVGKLAQKV
ncbi:hypothetical protein CMU26_05785 [Elizabethkingia anophelis]|nr:hypothetical protein [Elizabethkingia anophelis]